MNADTKRTAQADAAPVAQPDGLENSFGVLVFQVQEGQGRLTLPREISLPVLCDLQAALLAGQEYSSGVVLDWSEVSRCDVFFYQLLLAARLSYAKHSKSLMSSGPLPEDLRAACLTQGFGIDADDCILPQASL